LPPGFAGKAIGVKPGNMIQGSAKLYKQCRYAYNPPHSSKFRKKIRGATGYFMDAFIDGF
jgi:hypothetical protein